VAYQMMRQALRKAASPQRTDSPAPGRPRADFRGLRPDYSQRSPSESGQNSAAEMTNRFAPAVHEALRLPGAPLDDTVLAQVESMFNYDFSRVRVHTDRSAAEAAQAVDARAFTFGHDMVFGDHQFAPGTTDGMRLLAHELAHVMQQPTTPARLNETLTVTNAADSWERHADAAARGIVQPVTPLPSGVLCRQSTGSGTTQPNPPVATQPNPPVAKQPKVAKKTEQVKVADCREAVNWILSKGEVGVADARVANQQIRPRYTRNGGKVTATVNFSPEIDTGRSYTQVSVLSWPKMTPVEQKAVKDFTAAVQAHEDGHIMRAQEVLSKASQTIAAEGDSEADAMEKLSVKVSEVGELMQKQLDDATDVYDKITDHGRNQKAVGGENADLRCPAPSH
jgi:Domain of unknown function (DUF4157)/Bacterial protein of unknown function (DUF922)